MPDIKLAPAKPGRLNKPAWFRTHQAFFGPVRKEDGDHSPLHIHDVYLDGVIIGAVVGRLSEPGGSLRRWEAQTLPDGIRQHGSTRFEALDAVVRGHLPAPRLARAA